jgi:type I restriction enzyme R subunit
MVLETLYVYSQILLCIASNDAVYATNDTPEKFWAKWQKNLTAMKKNRI